MFIGVSAPNILTGEDVSRMAEGSIVFALANPVPEIDPGEARRHAAVVATGRSDYPNQINNVLAFPGVFRGLVDASVNRIDDTLLVAAAEAIASTVTDDELNANYIIPSVFHADVHTAVATAVRDAGARRGRDTARGRAGRAAGRGPMTSAGGPAEAGSLLVATPALVDPNFAHTVVLLLDHDEDGALGVVLNRPSPVPVAEVLPGWDTVLAGPGVIFQGGPVATDSALAVAGLPPGDEDPVGFRRLFGSTGIVDLDAPSEILAPALTRMRVFAGYAGWGSEQLEAEIEEGSWYVLPAEPADLFGPQPQGSVGPGAAPPARRAGLGLHPSAGPRDELTRAGPHAPLLT